MNASPSQEHDIANGGLRPAQSHRRAVHRFGVEPERSKHVGGGTIGPLLRSGMSSKTSTRQFLHGTRCPPVTAAASGSHCSLTFPTGIPSAIVGTLLLAYARTRSHRRPKSRNAVLTETGCPFPKLRRTRPAAADTERSIRPEAACGTCAPRTRRSPAAIPRFRNRGPRSGGSTP